MREHRVGSVPHVDGGRALDSAPRRGNIGRPARQPHMPDSLPQTAGDRLYLTDGGLETTLVFHRGIDLPLFAAFPLLDSEDGRAALRDYFAPVPRARRASAARASCSTPRRGARTRTGRRSSATTSRASPASTATRSPSRRELRGAAGAAPAPDARQRRRRPARRRLRGRRPMTAEEAADYHALQAGAFAAAGADMLTAVTMTYAEEATGVALAAAAAGLPVRHLLHRRDRRAAAERPGARRRDRRRSMRRRRRARRYYMVNCAHPTHFAHVVAGLGDAAGRIGGLRVNASRKSHAELDEATELDEGDPAALGGSTPSCSRTCPT